ncbi:hypothetical protein VCRLGP8_1640033 [Vibrio crassostreae]|nr:hypothetical protein VCRLGP8_1640033 [Vibrio crassostreae]
MNSIVLVRQIPKLSRFIAWFPFQQCLYVMFFILFLLDVATDRYFLLINALLLGAAFIRHLIVVWLAECEIAMDE